MNKTRDSVDLVVLGNMRHCGLRTYAESLAKFVPGARLHSIDFPTFPGTSNWLVRCLFLEARLVGPIAGSFVHSVSQDLVHRQSSVVSIHDVLPMKYPSLLSDKISKLLWHRNIRRAFSCPSIIVDSDVVRDELIKDHRVSEEQVHVVPLGVSDRFVQDTIALSAARMTRIRPMVLILSNVAPHKRVDIVLKGIADAGLDVNVVHVGHSWLRGDLDYLVTIQSNRLGEKYVRRQDLSNDELLSVIQTADVLVDANVDSGYGIPMLESGSCGTPCVSASTSSHGRDWAFYFEPLDSVGAASAIERAIAFGSDLRRRAGLAKMVSSNYSWKKTAGLVHEVYEKTIHRRMTK